MHTRPIITPYATRRYVYHWLILAQKTSHGQRLSSHLLDRKLTPKYRMMGIVKEGYGGLYQQINAQRLGPDDIIRVVKEAHKQ